VAGCCPDLAGRTRAEWAEGGWPPPLLGAQAASDGSVAQRSFLEREAHCLAASITAGLQKAKQDNEGRWSGEAATAHPFPPLGDGRGDLNSP
jgi:hypothetical protein